MLLDDIYAYLLAQGVGSAYAPGVLWPMYYAYLPDDHDQAIALFETGGYPPTELNRETENVTFMLHVRGAELDYVVARAKWQEAYDALKDASEEATSPFLLPNIVFIYTLHDGPMTWNDEKGRPNFTANFRVKRTLIPDP